MRHLAARHDITYLSFADPDADRGSTGPACARSARGSRPFRAPIAAKGTLRFYADAAALPGRSGAVRGRQVPLAAYRARVSRQLLATRALRRGRLRLPAAGREPAGAAALPVDPLHAQRRGGDLAAARRARRPTRSRQPARRSSGSGCCASSATRWRASIWCWRCPRPIGDTFARLYPGALRGARARRADRRRHAAISRRAPDAAAARAHRLHRLDGLAAERRRHDLLLPRHPAADPRRRSPEATLSIIGRAPTPAVRRLAEIRGVEVTGRVDDVRPHIARGGVYVVPLRIGGGTRLKIFEAMGDGQGRRLDHHRRRRPAGDRRDATSCIADEPARVRARRRRA